MNFEKQVGIFLMILGAIGVVVSVWLPSFYNLKLGISSVILIFIGYILTE